MSGWLGRGGGREQAFVRSRHEALARAGQLTLGPAPLLLPPLCMPQPAVLAPHPASPGCPAATWWTEPTCCSSWMAAAALAAAAAAPPAGPGSSSGCCRCRRRQT